METTYAWVVYKGENDATVYVIDAASAAEAINYVVDAHNLDPSALHARPVTADDIKQYMAAARTEGHVDILGL